MKAKQPGCPERRQAQYTPALGEIFDFWFEPKVKAPGVTKNRKMDNSRSTRKSKPEPTGTLHRKVRNHTAYDVLSITLISLTFSHLMAIHKNYIGSYDT